VRAPEEARALAGRAFELLLCKMTGQLTEDQQKRALKGLEAFFPEVFSDEESGEEGSEGRAEALRKALIPPVLQAKGEGAEGVRGLDLKLATEKELKGTRLRTPANPSLFGNLIALSYRLAGRGCFVRVRVVRVRDLALAKLLPPILAERLGEKVVRLELEVTPPSPFNRGAR
jgi:hypothetical protein